MRILLANLSIISCLRWFRLSFESTFFKMNIHDVNYDSMNKMTSVSKDSRLNMDMVKERAQVQLSHVINELSSLEMTCMIRRKRNL